MNQQKYYIVTLSIPTNSKDLIPELEKSALENYHCAGIEEFSLDEENVDKILGLRAYSGFDIPDEVFTEVEDETTKRFGLHFKFYFDDESAKDNANSFFKEMKLKHPDIGIKLIDEVWKDWNAEWKKHYKTLDISPRLKIIPEWEKKADWKKNTEAVYIIPGMGFGTGNHETTCLCLKLLDELKFPEKNNCLDFGCGSGILGIAAMKLHHSLVDFCDIDRKALDNCHENIKLNFEESGLNGQRLVARDRYTAPHAFYDITLANILEPVLMEEKKLLIDSLKPNGYLIVSGLLVEQLENIIQLYIKDQEMIFLKKEIKGQWGAILFQRKV